MSKPTVVRIFNSGFSVKPSKRMFYSFQSYLVRMYRYEFKKTTSRSAGVVRYGSARELKEKWCLESPENNEYRIHRSYLRDFRSRFKDYEIDYRVVTPNMGDDVEITMKDFFSPRGKQDEWIDFLSDNHETPHLALPQTMGAGKSVTLLATLARLNKRAAIMLPPFLSDRWMFEIAKFTNLKDGEYGYINGKTRLKSYMTTIEQGRNPLKIVLLAINTMRNYYRDYYLNPEEWIYSPEEFFAAAGFGVRGIDEAHKELHFHFISTLFFNVGRYIGLSGTLGKENEFLDDMSERLFPEEGRCPVEEVVASTETSIYKMYFDRWIPKHKSPMGYSHVIYENEIRYHPSVKDAYFMMLAKIMYVEFVERVEDDSDKGIIFLATVKLADEFTEFLLNDPRVETAYGRFRIGRLRAGESDDKCDVLDLVITTVGRAGTGFDLPGLLTVFNTISISDKFLQRQVLGRGRKRDDVNCRYVRIYSPHIRKHVDYHIKSMMALKDLSASVSIRELPGSMPYPTGYDFDMAKKTEGAERALRNEKKKKTKRNQNKRKKRR